MIQFIVPDQWQDLPLTKALQRYGVSVTMRRRIKHEATCYINGQVVSWRAFVQSGDKVEVQLPLKNTFEPVELPISICYEDDYLLVVNKPAGLLSHPVSTSSEPTLANAIAWHYEQEHCKAAFHPVHRLDRNTSGLLLVAKQPQIQYALTQKQLFHQRIYEALVTGTFPASAISVHFPIARKKGSIIERVVAPDGQEAHTDISLIQYGPSYSHVKVILHTGRTHQIRVHCSALGFPLLGDDLYGGSMDYIQRQALHARQLSFYHPIKKEMMTITSPLPDDMAALCATL